MLILSQARIAHEILTMIHVILSFAFVIGIVVFFLVRKKKKQNVHKQFHPTTPAPATAAGSDYRARVAVNPVTLAVLHEIRSNTYPYPISINVGPGHVGVTLWKDAYDTEFKSFKFEDYGYYGIQNTRQLRDFAKALMSLLPYPQYYKLQDSVSDSQRFLADEEKNFVIFKERGDSTAEIYYTVLNSVHIIPKQKLPMPDMRARTPKLKDI